MRRAALSLAPEALTTRTMRERIKKNVERKKERPNADPKIFGIYFRVARESNERFLWSVKYCLKKLLLLYYSMKYVLICHHHLCKMYHDNECWETFWVVWASSSSNHLTFFCCCFFHTFALLFSLERCSSLLVGVLARTILACLLRFCFLLFAAGWWRLLNWVAATDALHIEGAGYCYYYYY